MIVKGTGEEPLKLRRALTSIAPFVDGIFITLTGHTSELKEVEKVCKEFKVNVSYGNFELTINKEIVDWCKGFFGYDPHMKEGDKLFLFDDARNYNLSQIPKSYDWFIWMDCDDVFRGGEKLKEVAAFGEKHNIECFYFNYLYQVQLDKNGEIKHVLIQHIRERLLRNNDVYKWIAPIHETLIEQRPSQKTDNYDCDIVHFSSDEDRVKSLNRNLSNLEYSIYKTEGKDPRHIYYLAKAYFDIYTEEYNDKAEKLIIMYLTGPNPSGWPQERSQGWEYLCEIARRKGDHDKSIKALMNALIEDCDNPSIFVNLALSYMYKKDYERALFWVKIASSIPQKKTTLVTNPKDIQARTLEVIYNCCLNLSQVDEAWAAAVKLVEVFPDDEQVLKGFQFIDMLRQERDITKNVVAVSEYLKKTGERAKLKALVSAIPRTIEQNPFMVNLFQQNMPPKAWDKDEIAIFCGPGFTTWSPVRLDNPQDSFVGGSEEAVILMSKALSKQGWKVTVYADPGGDEGVYDGVTYLPYYKFNKLDHFNILIAWRHLDLFDMDLDTKKFYLWNHDIQNPLDYNPERIKKITKAIFLSKWHRDNVPELPENKVLISSNGV